MANDAITLAARREEHVVVLEGQVPSAAVKARWNQAALATGAGHVVDHVRCRGGLGSQAPWIPSAVSHLAAWLQGIDEGEIRWGAGRLTLSGRARSAEIATLLVTEATRALPGGWVLENRLVMAPRASLRIRWEDGAMLCDGALPKGAWQVRKVAWTSRPGIQLVIRDRVLESSAPAPPWLEELPLFLEQFQGEVREGTVEMDSSVIVLRGQVTQLATKLRLGREARAVFGASIEVRNYLEVDPSTRMPEPVIAAAAPPPASKPVASMTPAPQPAPVAPTAQKTVAAMAPAQPQERSKGEGKGNRVGGITIVAEASLVRLNGQLPDKALQSTIAGSCESLPGSRKIADRTEIVPEIRPEPWHEAIPSFLLAISEHLTQGEFRIEDGRASLQGEARSAQGRDRLLAAVARALPDDVRIDDRTTVPAEAISEGFSRNIFFNTGSTYIKPEYREHLREIVATLKANEAGATLLIKGHADPRGDPQINEKLSRERAKAVFNHLVKQGVSPKSLESVGVGAAESGDGSGEYVWKQERRVELTLVK